ncbi:Hypothetical predicted protein, partial [Paramuricea clavata]
MAESKSETKPDGTLSYKLEIYFAVYGPSDVTREVRSFIQHERLTVKAANSVFSDTWKGHRKTLVVVYRYGNSDLKQAIIKEGDTLQLTPPPTLVSAELGDK